MGGCAMIPPTPSSSVYYLKFPLITPRPGRAPCEPQEGFLELTGGSDLI
jgi:hypothetical protein